VNRIAGDRSSIVGREKGNNAIDIVRLSKTLEHCMPSAKSRLASVLAKLDVSVSTTPGRLS
jgi:hypothetical protein